MSGKICPYPGLRPFTQEESIFFKGRDLHIRQVINQLEERKIVMITGASGDGKSSLVYAGIIPNASAGFFHAEYNNWLFVDFRPERSPLENLSKSLASKLKLDSEKVHGNLKFGFSAIINLYKNSPYYIRKESPEWLNADEFERKKMKNRAANLLILADQFEEFFTNQENYNNGKTSVGAYTTVNLLLESSRIALKEKLPIFVVCTMRSDYISQCVAFKGLPETIGFSQFFVPRLKRNELQQVIEEPAKLSGGKMAKRLVEVLINDLREGFDQLPVLQHCLKELWILAENGDVEIDLIHLVKLAGMSPSYLSAQDKEVFEKWYSAQNDHKKSFFKKPSLANVLNSHAKELYLTAYDYFNENVNWTQSKVSKEDTYFIIKTAFQCLTKIDQGRAVRNRMSLGEITRIINKPHITTEVVCGVMNIYRLPLSTFVRPFIVPDDLASQYLSYSTILDITHESLIRNWDLLLDWENEEYQNLANFRDYQTQVQRWADQMYSPKFLLSPGNLSYFEEWYNNSNLNEFWIAKYDITSNSIDEKYEKAKTTATVSRQYLEESHKHLAAIARAKRMRQYIAGITAIVIILVLSGFTYWALNEKKNAIKQQRIAQEETEKTRLAKRLAEEEQKKAEQSAILANQARKQSDSARNIAENMRLLADEKTQLATSESENAKREKNRADEQLVESQKQRTIAESQKKLAEAATDSAKRLSYLATAQSLTFKAVQKYDEPQINLLLAWFAYKLNKDNNGNSQDQAIFQALGSVLNDYVALPIALENTGNISDFSMTSSSNIESITTAGDWITQNLDTKKIATQSTIKNTIPINKAFLLPKHILISYENYETVLYSKQNAQSQKLSGYTDFIRACIYQESTNLLITGTRNKKIRIHNLTDNSVKDLECPDRVTCLVQTSMTSEYFYAGLASGQVLRYDLKNQTFIEIAKSSASVTAMKISPDNKYMAVGTANGKFKIITLANNSIAATININEAMIESIAINQNSNLLAIASADKIIRVYRLNSLNAKPMSISKHNQNTKQIAFIGENTLVGYSADNKIRRWQIDNKILAERIAEKITRSLTIDEWKKFVGNEVEYQIFK